MAPSVLIVDDDEAVALTLREILADEGYRVTGVTSTLAALATVERERFDVALLDLRMGEESGLTVLSRLREISPGTVTLILTGYGSLESAVQAMRQGAFDYLLKPCAVAELKAAIARGLEQRRARAVASAEAVRTDLEQALQKALRVRDDFLALASHELKTPLSAIIGWTQYAQRQLARGAVPEAAEKLEAAVRQARRLARLVEAFVDVVHVQQGTLALSLQAVDLCSLVEGAVRDVRELSPRHRFHLELPGRQAVVRGDRARLEVVLGHLLENATKFSPDGGDVEVRVRTSGERAEVAVQDHGIGIAREELGRIFDRFYQGEADVMSRRFSGIGIGLYVSQALVEAHGGNIWVASPGPGQGSTFTVVLPLAEPGRPAPT